MRSGWLFAVVRESRVDPLGVGSVVVTVVIQQQSQENIIVQWILLFHGCARQYGRMRWFLGAAVVTAREAVTYYWFVGVRPSLNV
jgi:hypothetical protein